MENGKNVKKKMLRVKEKRESENETSFVLNRIVYRLQSPANMRVVGAAGKGERLRREKVRLSPMRFFTNSDQDEAEADLCIEELAASMHNRYSFLA